MWCEAEEFTSSEKTILNIVREQGVVSRTVIHKMTGIRLSTITDIAKSLISKGVLCEASEIADDKKEHVSKKALILNKDYACLIGVDVQISHVSVVLTDFCGNILANYAQPLSDRAEQHDIRDALYRVIDYAIERAGDKRILGIGVRGLCLSLYCL